MEPMPKEIRKLAQVQQRPIGAVGDWSTSAQGEAEEPELAGTEKALGGLKR